MFTTARSREEELEALKAQYLGQRGGSRKPARKKEKAKRGFRAEWNAADDTADTTNPLYTARMAPSLMFGRGTVAGADEEEQFSKNTFLSTVLQRRMAESQALMAESQAARQAGEQASQATAAAVAAAAAVSRQDDAMERSHWSEKPLSSMTSRDWRIMREDFDIRVKGGKALYPLRTWEEGHLDPAVMQAVREMGYAEPSAIQRQAIPYGLQFRDLIGVAETGSGKTAAFIIPMLHYIMSLPRAARDRTPTHGPHCLVMAPTRELAQQIEKEAIKLARFTDLRSVSVVGGLNIEEQGLKIRQGADLVIGTPGRLIDTVEHSFLMLAQCKYIVLDEADRMIDLGFEPQVKAILGAMQSQAAGTAEVPGAASLSDAVTGGAARHEEGAPRGHKDEGRVTIMFSATMPPEVLSIAKQYMRSPITVEIGDQQSGKNKRIKQRVIYTTEGGKARQLTTLLPRIRKPAIVFVNAKAQTESVARICDSAGFPAVVLTGAKTQEQREGALDAFRRGEVPILVATGVAERGLDIPDVAHVVNYDLPSEIDRYNHRIGRTGRAGKSGEATSFFTDGDGKVLWDLRQYLRATGNEVPKELDRHSAAQDPLDGAIFK